MCDSAVQLKLAYSRHKDLNVKGNNDRSFDYTQAATAQPGAAQPSYGAANRGNPAPIASYNGPNADLLAGGGGAPLGAHEMPPTGPPPACSITCMMNRQHPLTGDEQTRSPCTPLARLLAWKQDRAWGTLPGGCGAAQSRRRCLVGAVQE